MTGRYVRAYRWLLRLLPNQSGEQRAELEAAAVECVRRERARLGFLGGPYAAARLAVDAVTSAIKLRVSKERQAVEPAVFIGHIITDIRYALRSLRRQPGFTLVALLTLALGLGANTAGFSLVYGVFWRPLPYPSSDRLALITSEYLEQSLTRFPMSMAELVELRQQSQALESAGAYQSSLVNLGTDVPVRVMRAAITPELLPTLAVAPILGRAFTVEDTRPGAPEVTIVAWPLWQGQFGGRSDVIGARVAINDRPVEIVGVMPRGFDIHDRGVSLLEPLTIDPSAFPKSRTEHSVFVIARLKPTITIERARADLDRVLAGWPVAQPGVHTPDPVQHRLTITSLHADIIRNASMTLWLMEATVVAILLIACANLVSLLLTRANAQAREYVVRTALGASRLHVFRQIVVEGLVISVLGAALGVALAFAGLEVFLAGRADIIPRASEIVIDRPVLLFTTALTLLTGLVVSIVLCGRLQTARPGALLNRKGSRTQTAAHGLRSSLVVAQIAIAVTLAVTAGLLIRTVTNLVGADAGFVRRDLTTFSLVLPSASYNSARRLAFYQSVRDRLGSVQGVSAVATMTGLPPLRNPNITSTDFQHIPDNRPPGALPAENVDFYQTVSQTYLETMGIGVTSGRPFQPSDASGEPVALINETAARTFFADRDPIGGRVKPPWGGGILPWFTIVGVVADVRQAGMVEAPGTELYLLVDQVQRLAGYTAGEMHVVLRSSRSPVSLAPEIRGVIRDMDPRLPIIGLRSIDRVVADTVADSRALTMLLSFFAVVAVLLAASGTYGVLSFLVTERTREFGIRMALGAAPQSILGLVVRGGLTVSLLGLGIGLAGSVATARLASAFLVGVRPSDPLTLAVVSLLILAAALTACLVPAIRATRVDPLVALRDD